MAAHRWLRSLAIPLLCGALYIGFASAQDSGGDTKKADPKPAPKLLELPKALLKPAPESVEDLRAIEAHVQKVIQKVLPSVVGVQVGGGQGSGVIVKDDGTIITAGHVSGTPGQKARIILTNGKRLDGKTFGRNKGIDSGMMKIVGDQKYPALEMGKSSDLKPGQWVIAIGHPGGFRDNRGPVVRVGRILTASSFVIHTDCTLVGGDSGGPLFDMQGRVIGIHSRIGGAKITDNMHVPVDTYREEWTRLAAAEQYGKDLGQLPTVLSLGGKIIFEAKGKLTKDDATESAPDTTQPNTRSYHKVYNVPFKKGHSYTIDLVSGDKSGKKFDTYLRLESPAGKELAQDDDGGGFPHSRVVYRAAEDGDYRITATTFSPKQTGNFTLTVRVADFHSGQVEVLKAVRLPLPILDRKLQEWSKKKVQVHVHALLVDDKGTPLPNTAVTLKWNQGKEVLKSNLAGYLRVPLKKDNAKQLSFDLPKGTRAAFVLVDQDGENIPFKDESNEKIKSAGGSVVKTFEGAIKKTDPFDLERDKCYRQIHEFKMQAGKTYTVDLASDDFASYLRIENDDDGKLAEDADSGGFLNSRIVFTPKVDGAYRLVVTTCEAGQHGAYRLTIRETNAKPAEPKSEQK